MATSLVKCKVYDVGQGACNFIEIYDSADPTKPNHTILIDLGSTKEQDAAKQVVKQITETLKSMTTPTIDTLILTHSDRDHINYIQPLLQNFVEKGSAKPGTPLGINRVYYGGAYENYTTKKPRKGEKKNTLTAIKPYINGNPEDDLVGVAPDQGGWDDVNKKWKELRTVGDVRLTTLAGNTTTAHVDIFAGKVYGEAAKSYLRNMVSIVLLLSFADVNIVVTGDATGLTMARCNQILAKSGALPSTFMVTLPHHGSAETALNLLNLGEPNDRKDLAKKNVQEFADNIGAATITATAVRAFGHPSAHLMTFFWGKLDGGRVYYSDPALTPDNRHFYTAHFDIDQFKADPDNNGTTQDWPPSKNWYTVQTRANVFTTMYFLIDRQNTASNDWCAIIPPDTPAVKTAKQTKTDAARVPQAPYLGVTWEFSVDDKGTKSVRPLVNRPVLKTAGLPIGILGLDAPALASGDPRPEVGVSEVRSVGRLPRRPFAALSASVPGRLERTLGVGLRRLVRLP